MRRCEGVFRQGTDVDDVARATADHGSATARETRKTLLNWYRERDPNRLRFLVGGEEADAGVVDEDGDGARVDSVWQPIGDIGCL